MPSINETVLKETKRFEEALPELMKSISGKWVVFKDGEVQSIHDDTDEAYRSGVEKFGLNGGFIVGLVEPSSQVPISASALF